MVINTGSGNDTVVGGTAYMSITNPDGDLNVSGASGYTQIHSLGTGNINYVGATGGVRTIASGNNRSYLCENIQFI